MYHLLKTDFELKVSSTSPLQSKDMSTLFKDPTDILNRWIEHFTDLFYNPSVVNNEVINNLYQNNIILEMANIPTKEVLKALKHVNTGKNPDFDGIYVELLLHGGDKVHDLIYNLICNVWNGASVPQG